MRVAMVISSLQGGGAERVLSEMANYFVSLGWNISIISWGRNTERDAYRLDAKVCRVHLALDLEAIGAVRKLALNVSRVFSLRRAIRRARPDVVLSFMDTTNVVTILATRCIGVKVVVAERTDPAANDSIGKPWRVLRRATYRYADAVIAQTRAAGKWLESSCFVSCDVIPNPIRELPALRMDNRRGEFVLSVGRLSQEKGTIGLVRAFAQISASNPDWKLVMVGEGPQRQDLAAVVNELGLGDKVKFVGFSDTPERWMEEASIFVLNSTFEGFPNSLLEAMGMGLAVIATDCPSGPRELIQDRENGRLVVVGDVDALARTIRELIESPDLRLEYGRAAVRVRDTYALPAVMAHWQALLARVARV